MQTRHHWIHVFDARSIILSCVSSFDFLGHRTAGNPCKLQSLNYTSSYARFVARKNRQGPLDRHWSFRFLFFSRNEIAAVVSLGVLSSLLSANDSPNVARFVKSVEESDNRKWHSVPFDLIFASSGVSVLFAFYFSREKSNINGINMFVVVEKST